MITPTGSIGYFLLIYYGFKIVWNKVFGVENLFSLTWDQFLLPFGVLSATLLISSVLVFNGLIKRRRFFLMPDKVGNRRSIELKPTSFFRVAYLVLPLGTLLLGRYLMGDWAWDAPVAFRAFIQSGGMMYVYVTNVFIIQLAMVIFTRRIFIDRRTPEMWLLVGVPASALYSINTGFTSTILMVFFPSVLYMCFRRGWRIELLLPFFIPLAAFFAFTHLLYKRETTAGSSFSMSEAYRITKDNPDWDYGFLNRLDYPEKFVLSSRYSLLEASPDWGRNMLGFLVQPIPRSLWPEKPLTFSSYMTRELEPGNYYAGISANFGGMAELFNAFGLAGALIGVALLSAYFTIGSRVYIKACVSDWHFIFYFVVIYQLLTGSLIVAFVNDLSIFNAIVSYFLLAASTGCWSGNVPQRILAELELTNAERVKVTG